MYSPSTQGSPFDPLLTPFNLIYVLLPFSSKIFFLNMSPSTHLLLFLWRFGLFWGRDIPGPYLRLSLQNNSFFFPIPATVLTSNVFSWFYTTCQHLWRCDPTWVMASSFLRFLDHTQWRTTVGRTPLDEWSARRRDLYLTTHNTHNRQTSMPPVEFEPTISGGERPQNYTLDRAATGSG
jgi:hypothetical protein